MTSSLDPLTRATESLRDNLGDLEGLAQRFGTRLTTAFATAATQGQKLSGVMKSLALSLAQTALTQGLRPLGSLLDSGLSQIVGAGRVTAFANGGIVNAPTLFPLGGGTGLMGEAGPEAVMPLARGPDGRLGVRGGGGVQVTVNIQTQDAQSFQRSQSQVAAMMARAVARGQRNL
ncbi:MAG: phage tail tape measure protein [Hyphomicrobiales bacterium]